jgi:hypothetical protein
MYLKSRAVSHKSTFANRRKDRFKKELGNRGWSEKMDRCLLMILPVVKEAVFSTRTKWL